MIKNKQKLSPVSVIVPMKNSATTIIKTFDSLNNQRYPIKEIIVVDNVSSDTSIQIVEKYIEKSEIPIILIKRKENKGVGASYNIGTEKAKSEFVVFMHSDASLETKEEMTKLVKPLLDDSNVVATYSTIVNPQDVWETYNFWQKCLFSRAVGINSPGLNGKFDCIRRNAFVKVGGFDDIHFGEDIGIGGEDADLLFKLQSLGKVMLSSARVIHLHYLGKNYSLLNWIKNRKLLAKTYGRVIRVDWNKLSFGAVSFAIKPIISILPFIPGIHFIGLIILLLFSFWYMGKMYTTASTLQDPRILTLPFLTIFLVYYETFWMLESCILVKKEKA